LELPGSDPGSDGSSAASGGQRDTSTGDLAGDNPGTLGSQSGSGGSGDYSLDSLPGGILGDASGSGTGGQDTGTMTAAERAQVLDDRLQRGYEVFDGIILGERERAQAEINANPTPGGPGGAASQASGGGGQQSSQPQTLPGGDIQSGSTQAGGLPASSSSSPAPETFPAPEDIPSGRDDDVVARQLREAAMREPDPELREALWEEYRRYTGLSEQ